LAATPNRIGTAPRNFVVFVTFLFVVFVAMISCDLRAFFSFLFIVFGLLIFVRECSGSDFF
jgi:hypothetical protein